MRFGRADWPQSAGIDRIVILTQTKARRQNHVHFCVSGFSSNDINSRGGLRPIRPTIKTWPIRPTVIIQRPICPTSVPSMAILLVWQPAQLSRGFAKYSLASAWQNPGFVSGDQKNHPANRF